MWLPMQITDQERVVTNKQTRKKFRANKDHASLINVYSGVNRQEICDP